jgi:transcriptional regulator with XRE-family HTH domain
VTELTKEFRERRQQLGLSQAAVAEAAGIAQPTLSRIERGRAERPAIVDLWAIGAVLGLDVRLNAYPGGEPVHDHVQIRLLGAFRDRIHPRMGWLTEVPLPLEGDRRAWDAAATSRDSWTGIEAISRLGAADAAIRRARQKQRDDPRVRHVILLIADTRRNREAIDAARQLLATEFPLRTREVLRDLAVGRALPADGLVLMRVPARVGAARVGAGGTE